MDDLEQPVHARARGAGPGQGLTVAYLDCPRWDGRYPGD